MISSLVNFARTTWVVLLMWTDAFVALAGLARAAWAARGSKEGFRAGLGEILTKAPNQIRIMAVLRAWAPNVSLKRKLVQAYDNAGTAVVTRRADVFEVLDRDEDFEVVYEPRMRKLTDGENFFLGMQPGWAYTRDTSALHLAAARSDIDDFVRPRASMLAEKIVSKCDGTLDLPPTLTLQVPWDMTDTYFGTGGPTASQMQDWTTTLFWYLFGDLGADPELEARSMICAAELRAYLDGAIAARKDAPTASVSILNRCLALQSAGTEGMSDIGIRNNLLGILIGAIPTISKASCLALDELLRRPDALRRAQSAAGANDDQLLAGCIWEALRFNPHNPVIYRRAVRDTVIARSTLRQKKIREGQMVFASTLSAMFDRFDISDPAHFHADRKFEDYIIWGKGMHTCFGAAINAAVIPAILKPVLKQRNLRRADGDAGEIDTGATPFPQHFIIKFDPA